MKTFLLVCLSFALTSCGGGGGSSAPPTKHAVAVAMYGDSIVYGYTFNGTGYVQSSPTQETEITHTLADPLITISDHGDGGSTAAEWLYGGTEPNLIFPITVPWAQTMAAEMASVIVFQSGINDAASVTPAPSTQFLDEIKSLENGAKVAGKKFIIFTPVPSCRADLLLGPDQLTTQYAAAEVAYAKANGVPVVDVNSYLNGLGTWCSYLSDGVHPTPAGYQLMGEFDAKEVKATLDALEE